jgi:hypothetical protein
VQSQTQDSSEMLSKQSLFANYSPLVISAMTKKYQVPDFLLVVVCNGDHTDLTCFISCAYSNVYQGGLMLRSLQ